MNTKILMATSAILLGSVGIVLSFAPSELLSYLDLEDAKPFQLILQIIGALYFGFATLNWMTKSSLIGGIYNRPIALANFAHFFIAGMALVKGVLSNPGLPVVAWLVAGIYAILAICYAVVAFRHPLKETK